MGKHSAPLGKDRIKIVGQNVEKTFDGHGTHSGMNSAHMPTRSVCLDFSCSVCADGLVR